MVLKPTTQSPDIINGLVCYVKQVHSGNYDSELFGSWTRGARGPGLPDEGLPALGQRGGQGPQGLPVCCWFAMLSESVASVAFCPGPPSQILNYCVRGDILLKMQEFAAELMKTELIYMREGEIGWVPPVEQHREDARAILEHCFFKINLSSAAFGAEQRCWPCCKQRRRRLGGASAPPARAAFGAGPGAASGARPATCCIHSGFNSLAVTLQTVTSDRVNAAALGLDCQMHASHYPVLLSTQQASVL